MKKYMIGLLVTNKYGVLTRIASLFARRGYNIDTLTVGETVNPQVSRMTIMITGNDHDRDQMIKQLEKAARCAFCKGNGGGKIGLQRACAVKGGNRPQ